MTNPKEYNLRSQPKVIQSKDSATKSHGIFRELNNLSGKYTTK